MEKSPLRSVSGHPMHNKNYRMEDVINFIDDFQMVDI
jgi:hypothetical protein